MTAMLAPRKKILLVDDEAAIVHSLRYNLEKNGYAVTTADRVCTAWRTLAAACERKEPTK